MTRRTLVLLRHAKAAKPEGVSDVERPLTPRGHADAAAAGVWLAHRGYAPDLVLCSPSRRTRETWRGVALALTGAPQVRYDDDAYGANARELLRLVTGVGDEVETVLVIGHDPAMSDLSAILDPRAADPDGLRTCGMAVHTFDGSWRRISSRPASISATHTARA